MKRILLWVGLLAHCSLLSQHFDFQTTRADYLEAFTTGNNEIYIADSVRCFQYNEAAGALVPQLREYPLEHNGRGEVTKKLIEYWDAATETYANQELVSRSFDEKGVLIEEIKEQKTAEAAGFSNYVRIRYSRNFASLSEVTTQEEWDGADWVMQSRELYEYQDGIHPTSFTFQQWTGTDWINQFRSFTNYDDNNVAISTLFQLWQNDDWQNGNRTFIAYDSLGQLSVTEREIWSVVDTNWVTSSREVQQYENGENVETREEIYEDFSNTWLPQTRILKSYDADSRLYQTVSQTYFNESWVNIFKNTSIYDHVGNLTQLTGELWVEENWRLQNKCEFYYALFTSVSTSSDVAPLECIYMNPVGQHATFECVGLADYDTALLRIFNMTGQLVHHREVTNDKQFTIYETLPSACYQVLIQTEQGIVFNKKIIVAQ